MAGELLGMASSVLWAAYGWQSRRLAAQMSGPQLTAETFWRASVYLSPFAIAAVVAGGLVWRWDLVWVQAYCIVGGGVASFTIWMHALRFWPTSQVYLFNNLVPLSTMAWAYFLLGEAIVSSFWLAMLLIVSGVILGQTRWEKIVGRRWLPLE